MDELAPPTWSDFVAAWELFRDPTMCAIVAGAMLGFLSAYVVLRRMVFVSAAVSQAAGLGVALSFYAGIHWGHEVGPTTGAVVLSLAVSAALVYDPRRLGLSAEALLGLAFALCSAAAIVIGSKITQEANDIQAILFGTAVLVDRPDYLRVLYVAIGLGVLHLWWYRGLTFASFDPVAARVQKLPVTALHAVLLLSIGVAVGVSARALGSLPVFALSTLPAMAAVLLVRSRLWAVFVVAALLGAAAGGLGYVVAFLKDWPVGGSQTLVAGGFVALAAVVRGAMIAVASIRSGT